MNKRRRYRSVLVLGIVGLLLTVACGLWVRSERRQEALDPLSTECFPPRPELAALLKQAGAKK